MYTPDSSLTGFQPIAPDWATVLTDHGAARVSEILAAYDHWCQAYHLDPNVALSQACHECTYFTSVRWLTENNPAGLGITSNNTPPKPFSSLEEGIQAHASHLCCYAYAPNTCPVDHTAMVDRRHTFHEGLPTIAGLEAKAHWADPGTGYIDSLVAIANRVVGVAPDPGGPVGALDFLIDIRGQLPTSTAPGHGPQATGTTPRLGIVIHYSAVNYPADRAILEILQSEAQYHVDKDWGGGNFGDGLMYHFSVDPVTGDCYLCRNMDAVLWHCGAWVDGGNGSGYAVHVPGGDALVMTPAGLAGLIRLVEALRANDGISLAMVKGHQEVSPTACPGPLMQQFVLPYRAGQLAIPPVAPAPPPVPPAEAYLIDGYDVGPGVAQLVGTIHDDSSNPRLRLLGACQGAQHDEYLVTDNPDPATNGELKKIALPVVAVRFERGVLIWDRGRTPAPWDVRTPLATEHVGARDDALVMAVLQDMRLAGVPTG